MSSEACEDEYKEKSKLLTVNEREMKHHRLELKDDREKLAEDTTVKVREETKEEDEKEEESECNKTTSYREKRSTFYRAMSQKERQIMHPLEMNDKLAFDTIKTVRLKFLTDEAKAPIPRCQALPSHAFSKLTGRSILVSLSHFLIT